MAGAFLFGTGLIMLTGPISVAAIAITAVGLGIIVAGGFYIKDIGDRLYESTELMNAYLDGNADAGDLLTLRAGFHVLFAGIGTVGASVLSKPASNLFSKFHLDQRAGTFFSNAFSQTPGGCSQALEILNRISPKYANILTSWIEQYGSKAANYIVATEETSGNSGVETALDGIETGNIGNRISSSEVIFGSDTKSAQKLASQMSSRGWTEELVKATIDNPYTIRVSVNKATGNPATVFYTESGSHIIVDDVTMSIVQVSDNINPSTWIPDDGIIDPYIPGE